jgi:3-dehydroquinate synthase
VPRLALRDDAAALPILRRSAELHFEHIVRGGDPFEWRNARPLDFGHWAAHKLEQLSGYRLNHGEAVAIGIALDVTYSVLMGMLSEAEAESIRSTLNGLGLALYDDLLSRHGEVLDGLEEFRQHLGGRLTITLLEGIGRPVDAHEIEVDRMIEAMDRLRTCATAPQAEGRRPA